MMTRKLLTIFVLVCVSFVCVDASAAKKTLEQKRYDLLDKVDAKFKPLIQTIKSKTLEIDWTGCEIIVETSAKLKSSEPEAMDEALESSSTEAVKLADKVLTAEIAGPGVKISDKAADYAKIAETLEPIESSYDDQKQLLKTTYAIPIFGKDGLLVSKGAKLTKSRQRYGYTAEGSCDGIVIDARRCKFEPAAALKVLTFNKETVFSQDMMAGKNKLAIAPVIYAYMKHSGKVRPDAKSLIMRPLARARTLTRQSGTADAKLAGQLKKIFRRPLIINADPSTKNEVPGLIILASGSEKELIMHSEAEDLFAQGRVLVVTDKKFKTK